MKLLLPVVVLAAVAVSANGHPGFWETTWNAAKTPFRFGKEAYQGSRDMLRAYTDMRAANWKDSDKYFHARGNYDAAQRGPGGAWAAKHISNARERLDILRGRDPADSVADQEANNWGRSGGDPNRYRPRGLPPKY
ncbi:serum amyloid A-5 protein-like [Macrobrachium nipponense]|uniref:serum amyloid A-5 protein-like n=1 Tax=Macrobrachium nipponense TaxID=159736 RepID=UPI0030C89A48